jgi:hypothetical protein
MDFRRLLLGIRWQSCLSAGSRRQKISFKPSCNCRELPRSPRDVRVARICPNADDARLFTGWPKFGWLNRLNASARNCSADAGALVHSQGKRILHEGLEAGLLSFQRIVAGPDHRELVVSFGVRPG